MGLIQIQSVALDARLPLFPRIGSSQFASPDAHLPTENQAIGTIFAEAFRLKYHHTENTRQLGQSCREH